MFRSHLILRGLALVLISVTAAASVTVATAQPPQYGRTVSSTTAWIDLTPQSALPQEAAAVLSAFGQETQAIAMRAEAAIRERREEALQRLQELQDQRTRAGDLDGALAVRDRIRALRGPSMRPTRVAERFVNVPVTLSNRPSPYTGHTQISRAPANLLSSDYGARVGESFTFVVRGEIDGSVWGTNLYTSDSSLAAAAVHAGAVRVGEEAVVRVTVVDGPPQFTGTDRNGVQSMPWNNSHGAYTAFFIYRLDGGLAATNAVPGRFLVGNAVPETDLKLDPGTMANYHDQIGRSFRLPLVGATEGWVWGTDTYTHDSALATAAVHAGLLQPGQAGVVRVTITPSPSQFFGSSRNGVTSHDWDNTGGFYRGYRLELISTVSTIDFGVDPSNAPPPSVNVARWIMQLAPGGDVFLDYDPGTLDLYRHQIGKSFIVRVTATPNGSVWGTDVYTYDSSLAAAAIHSGVLQPGQTGFVRATLSPGPKRFVGSVRNGIRSSDWDNQSGSYAGYRLTLMSLLEGAIQFKTAPSLPVLPNPLLSDPLGARVRESDVVFPLPTVALNRNVAVLEGEDYGSTDLLVRHRGEIGKVLYIHLVGRNSGYVWGTDVYTDDSELRSAAVHAGVLESGESGVVKVTILPGRQSYSGTDRNGVISMAYGSYPGSYQIERSDLPQ